MISPLRHRSSSLRAAAHGFSTAVALAVLLGLLLPAASASAAASPAWRIASTSDPTNFTEADSGRYVLLLDNVGAAPTAGTLTLTDHLPTGVSTSATPSSNGSPQAWSCSGTHTVTCISSTPVPASGFAQHLEVPVKLAPSVKAGTVLENRVTLEGGLTASAPTASASQRITVTVTAAAAAPDLFDFAALDPSAAAELRAGAHPTALTTFLHLPTIHNPVKDSGGVHYIPAAYIRDAVVSLPSGFLGNPLATGPHRCPESKLRGSGASLFTPDCPADTQLGIADTETQSIWLATGGAGIYEEIPVYNLIPSAGYAAEFGFVFQGKNIIMYATLGPPPDYTVQVAVPGVTEAAELAGASLLFFGDPAEHDGGFTESRPFLTVPTRCTDEPLAAKLSVDSWETPATWASAESTVFPEITGCNELEFQPTVKARPTTDVADSPSGLDFELHLPQNEDPEGRATPELRDAVVTLPRGLAVNPSSADGLAACAAEGPEGINVGSGELGPEGQDLGDPEATELGAGHLGGNDSPYDDGLYHTAPGHCSLASQLGTVEAQSPLLPEPIGGRVFIAAPECAPCTNADAEAGKLVRLYIEIDDPTTGVIIKLPGSVSVDPASGQLTATFKQNPQLPVEDLKLHFKVGPRAPLRTPATCGSYETTTDFTPWSAPETPDATPSDSFPVSSTPDGGACPASPAQQPNSPHLSAGTANPTAGAYSPFVLKLSREDGSQELHALNVTLPPGLTGKLAGVGECSDAQIAAAEHNSGAAEKAGPSCPVSSELGTVNVGAGSGPDPFYVQGHAYLAGPYKGAPLSMAIVTPAVAGPFDLGTVVVRAALYVNPETAQITVKSDPIPTILAGIPLDVRGIAVNIARNQFTLNPTNCNPLALTATAFAAVSEAPLSSRFQVGGCSTLPFKPKLTIALKGSVKRTANPALTATLTQPPGQADIARAQVKLPPSAFLDNAHIGTVCTNVQFAAQQCPADSIYGTASATSPLLDYAVAGNVYLRSAIKGHKLPDLVADLHGPAGQPLRVALVGKTDSVKGALRNTFEAVPDVPVTSFSLSLFGGKKGLIQMSSGFCRDPRAQVNLTAQSGKVYDTSPEVQSSCKHAKKNKRHHG